MKIKWYGHASFTIQDGSTLIIDPHDEEYGKFPNNLVADIVLVTHEHKDHNTVEEIADNPELINHPGKFNSHGFDIKGIESFHDNESGWKRGKNTIFTIKSEDVSVCHLGDLGQVLTDEQISAIGKVDVLMIPVGGYYTIDFNDAIKVIEQLNPKLILPMHFKTPDDLVDLPIVPVDHFVQISKWPVETVDELEISRHIIDESPQRVILFHSASY